jgi:hypothetical protein
VGLNKKLSEQLEDYENKGSDTASTSEKSVKSSFMYTSFKKETIELKKPVDY